MTATGDGLVASGGGLAASERDATARRGKPSPALRVAVVFATRGRAEILATTVAMLARQTRQPDEILISAVSAEDLGPLQFDSGVRCVLGEPGLPRQRNAAIRELGSRADIIVFFDDDFFPHPDWIRAVERYFLAHPSVAAITGHVVADGIHGPGLTVQQALRIMDEGLKGGVPLTVERYSPYGCNMAFRFEAIKDLYFDERLVLYGWLEDRDFGGALLKRGGKSIKLGTAIGVHLGAKEGRVSGRRLGYSQIVNPFYLHRKGTMTTFSLVQHLFRNVTSNVLRSIAPERHIDRTGRLYGNVRGVRDLLSGIMAPERAEFL